MKKKLPGTFKSFDGDKKPAKGIRVPQHFMIDDMPLTFHSISYDGKHTEVTYIVEYMVKGSNKVKFEKLTMTPYDFAKHGSPINPEQPSRIVRQGKYECGPAALAMILNEPFYLVKKAFSKVGWSNNSNGVTHEMDIKVARMFGRDLIEMTKPTGKPCIMTVPSLNLKDRWHAIAWDGKQILDPNHGYEGRKYWTPEWAPWTIGASRFMVLLDKALSDAERKEIDEWRKYRDQATIEALREAVFKALTKDDAA